VLIRLSLVAALALTLTACGRKGPLDPPPTAGVTPTEQPAVGPIAPPIGSGAAPAPAPANPPSTPPNRPFLLDPMLN
jgi:hypothetical protein